MAGSDDHVRAHIESISRRTQSDLQMLTAALQGRSWPGGGGDRSEPGALAWVRRWRPSGPVPALQPCECSQGRCLLCN